MHMHPVSSTQVASIGHDPTTKVMRVEFKKGGVYEYEGVSPETHQAIISAGSVGSALRTNVAGLTYRKIG